jgi:hypothetical protein
MRKPARLTQSYVTDTDLHHELQKAAEEEDRSVSSILRMLSRNYLESRRRAAKAEGSPA